jgi:hypothetical protein
MGGSGPVAEPDPQFSDPMLGKFADHCALPRLSIHFHNLMLQLPRICSL